MKAFLIPANNSDPVKEIDFDHDKAGEMSSRDITIQTNMDLYWAPFLQKRTPHATIC
jgi:hypothetical protein